MVGGAYHRSALGGGGRCPMDGQRALTSGMRGQADVMRLGSRKRLGQGRHRRGVGRSSEYFSRHCKSFKKIDVAMTMPFDKAV